jgi:hypothetical protein
MAIPAGPDTTSQAVENGVQRDLTAWFVQADQDLIVLNRPSRTANGSGGYVLGTPAALPSQAGRLIPLQPAGTERHTLDGRLVEPGYHLLMEWNADMQRGDTFVLGGRRYEVVFVAENQVYEVKGEVIYNGDA